MTMMMKLYGKSKRTAKAQRRAVLQWVRGAHATLRRKKKFRAGACVSGVCRRTFSFSFFFSLKPLARGRRREKKRRGAPFLPSFLLLLLPVLFFKQGIFGRLLVVNDYYSPYFSSCRYGIEIEYMCSDP